MLTMNEKIAELRQKRGELLARIAAQRIQLAEVATQFSIPLALADKGVAAARYLRSHPLLVAGITAFFVARRRGLAGLLSVGRWLWKGYRYFNTYLAK